MINGSYESWEEWRAQVPWTDAQILAAMRLTADTMPSAYTRQRSHNFADYFERTGRLSSKMLGFALGHLVTTCEVCGKKAHYRIGNHGRCSTHRDVKAPDVARHWARKSAAHNTRNVLREAALRRKDESEAHHHAVGRRHNSFK